MRKTSGQILSYASLADSRNHHHRDHSHQHQHYHDSHHDDHHHFSPAQRVGEQAEGKGAGDPQARFCRRRERRAREGEWEWGVGVGSFVGDPAQANSR